MKIKMKFKPVHPDGSVVDGDVIVLKVKREDWNEFSKLLAAGRQNADSFGVDQIAANKIENKFDSLYNQHG